jgi:hypothetical protein
VVEHLPSKWKVLSLNPNTSKKIKANSAAASSPFLRTWLGQVQDNQSLTLTSQVLEGCRGTRGSHSPQQSWHSADYSPVQ